MHNRNVILIRYLILLMIFNAKGLFAQNIDTLQLISKIRKQYGIIINKQIENISVVETDNSYKPTKEEMDEGPFAAIEKFTVYHTKNDTFLMRKYNMNDEGGAFSHAIEEVLFWDNKPFFYYKKTYGSWDQILEETRVYIDHGNIIQKLTKESIVPWSELTSNFYDLQTDVPNQKSLVERDDLDDIKYFIESSEDQLNDLKNK